MFEDWCDWGMPSCASPAPNAGVRLPHRQLATVEQLRAAASPPRRRGQAALERALTYIRVGSMSPLETDLRMDLQDAGLPEPVLDVEVRSSGGRLLGIADGAYPEYGVLLEVEGRHHLQSDAQWERDIAKYAAFAAAGHDVVRLTGRSVRGGRAVATVIEALRRHGWRG